MNIILFWRNKALSLTKNVYSRNLITVTESVENKLKYCDQVPKNFSLIYRQKNVFWVKFGHHGMTFLSSLTLGSLGYFFVNDLQVKSPTDLPVIFKNHTQLLIGLTSVFIVGLLTIRLCRRHPIRIYYSNRDKKYRAIFIGRIPLTLEKYDFDAGTVQKVTSPLYPFNSCTYSVNGRKMILFDEKFRTYQDFHEMVGLK